MLRCILCALWKGMRLVDTLFVLAAWFSEQMLRCFWCPCWHYMWCILCPGCFRWAWSTHVEIHFVRSLATDGFDNTCWDPNFISFGMGWVWSTIVLASIGWVSLSRVEMHFVYPLAWNGFSQHKLRYILALAGIACVWSTPVEMKFVSPLAIGVILVNTKCPHWHVMRLVNTSWGTFCVLAGMGVVWSNMLRCILFSRWLGTDLVNIFWDTFCDPAGSRCVRSTQVEIHFLSSLAWEWFGQHRFRWILNSRWRWHVDKHFVSSLVWDCWDVFCVFTVKGWVVEIRFVSPVATVGLVLRYILGSRRHEMDLVITRWDAFCMLAGREVLAHTQRE
jgi:hypothetical protein